MDRLKGLVNRDTILLPVHGNADRNPQVAYNKIDREKVKAFIRNFKEIHGLPDPGRDVRKGKGKLRVLLPSIMSFQSVHEEYRQNIEISGGILVGYRTFISIWQTDFPHLKFNDPRSDLCMTCEDFKKRINQVAAALNEGKDKKREQLHREALAHLMHMQKGKGSTIRQMQKWQVKTTKRLIQRRSIQNLINPIQKILWDITHGISHSNCITLLKINKWDQFFLKHPGKHNCLGFVVKAFPVSITT